MSPTGHIAAVIPTFNGARVLAHLLESLEQQTVQSEIVVVDNGSSDETADVVRTSPDVRLVSLPTNLGFGRAVNRGVAATDATTLVLLNNDVVCEPTFVERVTGALDPPNGIAMAAGVLLQRADPELIDTAGIEVDRTFLGFDYLHGERVEVLDQNVPDPFGPCGGAAAYDRAAFDSVGGFDESFFAYLEDIDLAIRLVKAGARCRLARGARGVHRHSTTLGARSRRKAQLVAWGRGYIIGKYRFHRRPRLFARTLAIELTGTLGKAAADRHGIALGSAFAGWRAGAKLPAQTLPAPPRGANEISFVEAQRRRIRRRLQRSRRSATT